MFDGKQEDDFLALDGTAEENGRAIGEACRRPLGRRIATARAVLRKKRVPESLIRSRVADFTRLVQEIAPHWLEEAAGMAEGSGVERDDIVMLNCLPPGLHVPAALEGNCCTSFVAVGEQANLLFKIRDHPNHAQSFFTQSTTNLTRGKGSFQAGRDIGNIGVGHFFNSRALAGGNNTGSRTSRVSEEPRLNDCHMFRYFAENASCIDDIPRLVEKLLDARAVGGGGGNRGSIFIFADPSGGLIVEAVSDDYSARSIPRGTAVVANHFATDKARDWQPDPPARRSTVRKERMERLLAESGDYPSPLEVFGLSRDRANLPTPLCSDDTARAVMTVSAELQVIDRARPEDSVNYICCGNTRNSLFVPVPLGFTKSYVPLLSGEHYACANTLYRRHSCSPHLREIQDRFERRITGSAAPSNAVPPSGASRTFPDTEAAMREAYRTLRQAAEPHEGTPPGSG